MVVHHIERFGPAHKRTIYRGTVLAFIAGAAWFGFNAYQIASKEPVPSHCDPSKDTDSYEEIVLGADTLAVRRVWYIDRCGDGTVDQYIVRGAGNKFTTSKVRNGSAEVVYTSSTRMTPDDEARLDEQYRQLRSIYLTAMSAR